MVLLDEVQELRELPEDSFKLIEHNYAVNGVRALEGVMDAFTWIESAKAQEMLYRKHPNKCLLVFGRRVIGVGDTWDQAYEMASKRGTDPYAAVRFSTFLDDGCTL